MIASEALTTREEFENGGFTLKTHQMCSAHTRHTTPEEFEECFQSENASNVSRSHYTRDI